LQELLSGISERAQQARVLAGVRESFPVVLATEGDQLKAADLVSLAASRGTALSTSDALIAAQALNRRASLMTSDVDFQRLTGLGALKLL
jgi:predicted nucleic acid-binding protein